METEYFPRPGYDGYCLMGQEEEPEPELEEARTVVVEAGLVLTSKIDIDIGRGRAPGRARELREVRRNENSEQRNIFDLLNYSSNTFSKIFLPRTRCRL